MTKIGQIRAEIERLKSELKDLPSGDYKDGVFYVLEEELTPFINSLTAEEQNDDLDSEIKLYQLRNPVINHNERSLNDLIKRVAIYFADWQKEQILKNSVAVDIWESSFSGECYIHNKAILDDLINRACHQGETVRIAIIKETTNYAERD